MKSVVAEVATFEEQVDQVIEKPLSKDTMTFNEEGWLIEQTADNSNGFESRTVNDYSDSQKLLRTRVVAGAYVDEVTYIYDSEERLVAEQHLTNGELTTPITYSYDTEGGKTRIQELDEYEESDLTMIGVEGTINSIDARGATLAETRYDAEDKAIEIKMFDTPGSLVSRIEITYDARGNQLEHTAYHGDVVRFGPGSSSTEEMESLTDEQKAELEAAIAQMFSPGTAAWKHTNKYDVEGKLIESELTMMGTVVNRNTFSYDEAGNKSEETGYSADGAVGKAIFTREYDEHGNWTKELHSTVSSWDAEFGLSTPIQVTRRTITYFT